MIPIVRKLLRKYKKTVIFITTQTISDKIAETLAKVKYGNHKNRNAY